ncbi:MAG: hypothetical protein LRS49_05890 [Desulfurococcales archaeon]|nr:hypothetical protein [Desulfurococcales archaeon]
MEVARWDSEKTKPFLNPELAANLTVETLDRLVALVRKSLYLYKYSSNCDIRELVKSKRQCDIDRVGHELGSPIARRARELPALAASYGLFPALSFYLSKAAEAKRVIEALEPQLRAVLEGHTKPVDAANKIIRLLCGGTECINSEPCAAICGLNKKRNLLWTGFLLGDLIGEGTGYATLSAVVLAYVDAYARYLGLPVGEPQGGSGDGSSPGGSSGEEPGENVLVNLLKLIQEILGEADVDIIIEKAALDYLMSFKMLAQAVFSRGD